MGGVGQWLTPGGLFLLLALSVARGWLIPRPLHLDRIKDKDKALALLERAIEDKNATIAEKDRQLAMLLGFAAYEPPSPAGGGGLYGSATSRSERRRSGRGRNAS